MKMSEKAFPIKLEDGQSYQRLLAGPPQNRILRSGMVCLQAGDSVGKHNTNDFEELVIVLKGHGLMVGDQGEIPINPKQAAYCPPHTEHNVKNTGKGMLRYIYIVSKTK